MGETIYHLTTATALASHREGALYRPPSLEIEGFVHCSGDRPVTLGVAQSYFGRAGEPVWVLVLEVERLGAEVRWEAPAPLAAGPQAHHHHEEQEQAHQLRDGAGHVEQLDGLLAAQAGAR